MAWSTFEEWGKEAFWPTAQPMKLKAFFVLAYLFAHVLNLIYKGTNTAPISSKVLHAKVDSESLVRPSVMQTRALFVRLLCKRESRQTVKGQRLLKWAPTTMPKPLKQILLMSEWKAAAKCLQCFILNSLPLTHYLLHLLLFSHTLASVSLYSHYPIYFYFSLFTLHKPLSLSLSAIQTHSNSFLSR